MFNDWSLTKGVVSVMRLKVAQNVSPSFDFVTLLCSTITIASNLPPTIKESVRLTNSPPLQWTHCVKTPTYRIASGQSFSTLILKVKQPTHVPQTRHSQHWIHLKLGQKVKVRGRQGCVAVVSSDLFCFSRTSSQTAKLPGRQKASCHKHRQR